MAIEDTAEGDFIVCYTFSDDSVETTKSANSVGSVLRIVYGVDTETIILETNTGGLYEVDIEDEIILEEIPISFPVACQWIESIFMGEQVCSKL